MRQWAAGEPIVGTPVDAPFSLEASGIDSLVLEDFLLDRTALPDNWPDLLAAWRTPARSPFTGSGHDQRGAVYVRVRSPLPLNAARTLDALGTAGAEILIGTEGGNLPPRFAPAVTDILPLANHDGLRGIAVEGRLFCMTGTARKLGARCSIGRGAAAGQRRGDKNR